MIISKTQLSKLETVMMEIMSSKVYEFAKSKYGTYFKSDWHLTTFISKFMELVQMCRLYDYLILIELLEIIKRHDIHFPINGELLFTLQRNEIPAAKRVEDFECLILTDRRRFILIEFNN